MKKFILVALLIGLLAVCNKGFAAVDTADEVDMHSNTVVEGLVTGVSDISDGNTIDVGEVGGIYIDGGTVVGGASSAQVVTGAGVIKRISFNTQVADSFIEIYDGTSRGTFATCKADPQGHVALDVINVLMSASFSTGIYVHSSNPSNTWQIEYIQSDQGE